MCQSTTSCIISLLLPVPQLRVVDANSPNSLLVFCNNIIFHNDGAVNHGSTAPGASVHAKEFVYTTLWSCRCQVQSKSREDDKNHPQHHNIHEHSLLWCGEQSLHINFVTWKEIIQKQGGNILTEFLRITVSRMSDERHVPQCINQTNEPTKMSFSLPDIFLT